MDMLITIPKRVLVYWNTVRRQKPSNLESKVSIPKRVLALLTWKRVLILTSHIYIEDTS